MKELVYKINHEENFDKAKGMLEMFNAIYGTKYFIMNRRVTERKENRFHDVWAKPPPYNGDSENKICFERR